MLTLLRSGSAAGCPRCGRQVAPEDLEGVPLVELRLIDPHLEGYVRHAAGGQVAVCQDCGDQLDALAGELAAYRRRLLRVWPTPRAHRAAPREDQCLSRRLITRFLSHRPDTNLVVDAYYTRAQQVQRQLADLEYGEKDESVGTMLMHGRLALNVRHVATSVVAAEQITERPGG